MKDIIGKVIGLAPSADGVYITILAKDIDMRKAVAMVTDTLDVLPNEQVSMKKNVSIKVIE